jgi:hypothetical protein
MLRSKKSAGLGVAARLQHVNTCRVLEIKASTLNSQASVINIETAASTAGIHSSARAYQSAVDNALKAPVMPAPPWLPITAWRTLVYLAAPAISPGKRPLRSMPPLPEAGRSAHRRILAGAVRFSPMALPAMSPVIISGIRPNTMRRISLISA